MIFNSLKELHEYTIKQKAVKQEAPKKESTAKPKQPIKKVEK